MRGSSGTRRMATPASSSWVSARVSGWAGPISRSRYAPISSRASISPSDSSGSSRLSVALSAHCRSSRKTTSGCSRRARIRRRFRMTRRKRFWVSVAPSAGAWGCGPRREPNSGTTSASTLAPWPRPSVSRLRQAATCSSSSVRTCWTSSRKAWSRAPYGTLATWSNFPAMKRPCRPTDGPVELPDQGRLPTPA